jgi:isopropylmalate/homocitrate/citramalate synthase
MGIFLNEGLWFEHLFPRRAIVGRNAFAHESGIHQDGMLKHTQAYEIMTPESVGVKQTSLVMGKHSGRHAFMHKLKDLGYKLSGNQVGTHNRANALPSRMRKIRSALHLAKRYPILRLLHISYPG